MKLKQWSQSLLAVAASLGAGAGLVSCGTSNTVDYLYAVSAKNNPGQIDAYRVDSQSGALTQIPTEPFPTGRNPVSLVIDSVPSSGGNKSNSLYLVNHDDNTVAQYAIGTDGKLYHQQNDVNPSGSEPVSLTVHSYPLKDSSGKLTGAYAHYLYVVETYQPTFTDLAPGPGALYVYLLDPASGQIGSPTAGVPVAQTVNGQSSAFLPLGTIPTGLGNTPSSVVATQDGAHVYVTDLLGTNPAQTGTPTCGPGQGAVQGYNMQFDGQGNPTGVLQTIAGSPFCAGVTPSAIASHPFVPTPFLYVTDSSQNQVITFSINTTTGALSPLTSSPTATGTGPDGITVDPRGLYVYVANKFGASVSGYAVNQANGALSAISSATGGSGNLSTEAQPGCVIVEPALARFVYVADFLGNSVNGFVLDPNTGALSATQGLFYAASGLTSCVAAIQHGNHPVITTSNQAFPNGG